MNIYRKIILISIYLMSFLFCAEGLVLSCNNIDLITTEQTSSSKEEGIVFTEENDLSTDDDFFQKEMQLFTSNIKITSLSGFLYNTKQQFHFSIWQPPKYIR